MNFQKSVVLVAIIILIIVLIFIGYMLNNFHSSKKFPPVISECPDYWIPEENKCTNPKNLGTLTSGCKGPKNFDTDIYNSHNGDCLKAKWANSCNLVWQGITTDNTVCDDKLKPSSSFFN